MTIPEEVTKIKAEALAEETTIVHEFKTAETSLELLWHSYKVELIVVAVGAFVMGLATYALFFVQR
jgi:hypothetical protein